MSDDKPFKTLVILRHAHRDLTDRTLDNGLNAKGKLQAKRLAKFYGRRYAAEWPLMISSPRRRCQETLAPIARKHSLDIQENRLLIEQLPTEDHGAFVARIDSFFAWWTEQDTELIIACTHGDWISTAMQYLFRNAGDYKKGCWIELQNRDGAVALSWLIQSFKFF